jgi:hypothetical protein
MTDVTADRSPAEFLAAADEELLRELATRRRQATAALNHRGILLPAAQPHPGDPHAAHDRRGGGARGHDRPATLTATPACPHCKQPVAIVAWLVPPAAATVATPPQHAVTTSDNQ